jgi:hypothetical protein
VRHDRALDRQQSGRLSDLRRQHGARRLDVRADDDS